MHCVRPLRDWDIWLLSSIVAVEFANLIALLRGNLKKNGADTDWHIRFAKTGRFRVDDCNKSRVWPLLRKQRLEETLTLKNQSIEFGTFF